MLNSLTYLQRDRNLQALDLCTYPVVSLSLVTEPPLAPCLALSCCPRTYSRDVWFPCNVPGARVRLDPLGCPNESNPQYTLSTRLVRQQAMRFGEARTKAAVITLCLHALMPCTLENDLNCGYVPVLTLNCPLLPSCRSVFYSSSASVINQSCSRVWLATTLIS